MYRRELSREGDDSSAVFAHELNSPAARARMRSHGVSRMGGVSVGLSVIGNNGHGGNRDVYKGSCRGERVCLRAIPASGSTIR